MWKRVRKPLPAEAAAAPKRPHLTDPPLTVAELGHEVEVHTLPDGTLSDHIINSATRQEFNPSYLRFGVMTGDHHSNEQGFLMWCARHRYRPADRTGRSLTMRCSTGRCTRSPRRCRRPSSA